MTYLWIVLTSFIAFNVSIADIYLHNPRGSNNRNCEKNVNRNNANRLFDSQNNAQGGYACDRPVAGPEYEEQGGDANVMTFYSGSVLPIEWTSQHGCGENTDVHCQVIIQYACEDTLDPDGTYAFRDGKKRYTGAPRDGTPRDVKDAATDLIKDINDEKNGKADTTENRRFGLHETQKHYLDCRTRRRNGGLFTADQKVNRRDARGTRQNPNGNRYGFECPEERDYYPYWHPTPWVDIAVVTSNYREEKIQYYNENSQNNIGKGYCKATETLEAKSDEKNMKAKGEWYNNYFACKGHGHQWVNASAHNQPFEVVRGGFGRANHLGNVGMAGENQTGMSAHPAFPSANSPNRYHWKIPDKGPAGAKDCVLRLRYNISTSDYNGWMNGDIISDEEKLWSGTPGINSSMNGKEKSPIFQDPRTYFDSDEIANKENGNTDFLTLAVNTNQYGRTFEDRSFTFSIESRPKDIPMEANIYNLNVKGKRGNIVQVYPSVEYGFIPDHLITSKGDYVHIQWTGSDYNPRRGDNDGEGGPPEPPKSSRFSKQFNINESIQAANQNSRADRSNFVMMRVGSDNTPEYFKNGKTVARAFKPLFFSPNDARYFAFLEQESDLKKLKLSCLSEDQLKKIKNKNQRENHPQNCGKLNGASSPYFKGKLVKMVKQGNYTYFCTRNNNFSNRDQTGHIAVSTTNFKKHLDIQLASLTITYYIIYVTKRKFL